MWGKIVQIATFIAALVTIIVNSRKLWRTLRPTVHAIMRLSAYAFETFRHKISLLLEMVFSRHVEITNDDQYPAQGRHRLAGAEFEMKLVEQMKKLGYNFWLPTGPRDVAVDVVFEKDGNLYLVECKSKHLANS